MWSNRTKHNFYIEKHGEISSLPRFTYTCKYSCLSEEILGWVLYWLYLQHVHTQLMEIYCCLWFFFRCWIIWRQPHRAEGNCKGQCETRSCSTNCVKDGEKDFVLGSRSWNQRSSCCCHCYWMILYMTNYTKLVGWSQYEKLCTIFLKFSTLYESVQFVSET